MSSAEESPAQQAARLRRERREAKIKAGGSARLDKITSLSGRTPTSAQESGPSSSSQPESQTGDAPNPTPQPQTLPPPSQPPNPSATAAARPGAGTGTAENITTAGNDSENLRAQQEYLRALLRANPPEQHAQQEIDQDPMMKVLSSMLGGLPGAENTAPGAGLTPPNQGDLKMNDLASTLGIPPLLSNMIFGGGAASQQEPTDKKKEGILKIMHILFATIIGVYLVMLIGSSVATYGFNPPPPATAQNPFVVFMTMELVLMGARTLLLKSQQGTLATGLRIFRTLVRDGSIVIFILGVASWWNGGWKNLGQ